MNKYDIIRFFHILVTGLKKDGRWLPEDEYGSLMAAMMYVLRRDRLIHPEVIWDNSGLPHVSGEDKKVLGKVRPPSQAHPYTEMNSARTLAHCCRRFCVEEWETPVARRFVAALDGMLGNRPRKKYAERYEQTIRKLIKDQNQ